VSIAYLEQADNKSIACKREYQIRHLSKQKKELLASNFAKS